MGRGSWESSLLGAPEAKFFCEKAGPSEKPRARGNGRPFVELRPSWESSLLGAADAKFSAEKRRRQKIRRSRPAVELALRCALRAPQGFATGKLNEQPNSKT